MSQKNGFSLVELMIVISLIGVLAAIGIPQYNKFRFKAYESEAKAQLAALYTAEHAFFTEYTGYHHSLKVLGYASAGRTRYNVGFGAPGVTPVGAPVDGSTMNTKRICGGTYGLGPSSECDMFMPTPEPTPAATITANTFTAVAVGYENLMLAEIQKQKTNSLLVNLILDGTFAVENALAVSFTTGNRVTQWGINQDKVLSHTFFDETDTPNCYQLGQCTTNGGGGGGAVLGP